MDTPQNTTPVQNPVKRTFWFGMLGVLAVLPYAFDLVVDSWQGRFFTGGFLYRKSDAVVYDYFDRVLPIIDSRLITFIYVFCWAFALGAGIRMIYTSWRESEKSEGSRGRIIAGMILKFALALPVVYAGSTVGLDAFYFYPPEGIMLLQTSYGGPAGSLVLYFFPMAQLAAFAFTLSALVYAVISPDPLKWFTVKASVGAAALLIMYAVVGSAAGYLDLGRYLDDIPGVSGEPEPRTLLILSSEPESRPLSESYNDCSISATFCTKIISSGRNADAVSAYLDSRSYRTALRGAGLTLIALNSLRELDPYGALIAYEKAMSVTGDATQGISAIARFVHSPATEAYHGVLEELSDEERFVASGRTALRLSKAYARFGELDKARYWYEKGQSSGGTLKERDKTYFSLPEKPPFSSGRIEGRLTLQGVPAEGVRVGLVRSAIYENIASISGGRREVVPFTDLQGLTDGTATDGEGRFSFSGLEEHEYVLMLSIKDVDGKRCVVTGSSGPVKISENNPTADVGVIRLSLEYI